MNRRAMLSAFLAAPVAVRMRSWVKPAPQPMRVGDWILYHPDAWVNWQPGPIYVSPAMLEQWERLKALTAP